MAQVGFAVTLTQNYLKKKKKKHFHILTSVSEIFIKITIRGGLYLTSLN